MAHTASCGNATTRTCRCGGCAGSRHGWTGALVLAQPTMAGARTANHRSAERAWADATKPRSSRWPTQKRARAAVNGAKDDIEDWLGVFGALCEALGHRNNNKIRAELAEKHFFCSLLAEIACSMQTVQGEIDRAAKQITTALLSYYIGQKNIKMSPFLTNVVTEVAAKGIGNLIVNLPAARNFQDLLRAVRILALMTCPAPEKHEAVVRCALKPLGQPVVSELVQERLKTAMPDWMV